MATLAELREKLAEAKAKKVRMESEMTEIHGRAGDRGLSEGEQTRWERLEAGIRNADREAEEIDREMRNQIMRIAQNPANCESGDGGRESAPRHFATGGGDLRGRALTAIERANGPRDGSQRITRAIENDDDPKEGLAQWVIAASDPDYLTCFGKLLADPLRGGLSLTPAEQGAYHRVAGLARAMSLTDANGGFMVPFTLDPAIMLTNTGSVNPMRQVARVEVTATDSWSGITSAGVTASWDAEAGEVSDDSPTVAQPTIPVFKGAAFIAASIEVASDARIGEQVGMLFADAKDQLESAAFTTGTGSGQPTGIITAVSATAGSVVATGTADTYAIGDPYALQNALPPRWRARARWMANLSIINATRRFAEGSTNPATALVQDFGEGAPQRMLGWPLHENSAMDGVIDASANNYILLAGDFSQYAIIDRVGASVEFIPHLFGTGHRPTGQRGWYMHWRAGANVLVPDAFRLLNA